MIERRFPPAARVLAIALAGCLAGCGTSHATTSSAASPSHGAPRPVPMPPVVGDPLYAAKQAIRAVGFDRPPRVMATPNDKTGKDQVIATNPLGGKVVLSDSLVTIFVASGPMVCLVCSGRGTVRTMPPVCGLTMQEANLLLVESGITLDQHPIHRPSSKPAGTVIGSAPAAGTRFIAYGSRSAREVVVTISSGRGTSPAPQGQAAC